MIQLRRATMQDAEKISTTHIASIEALCKGHYSASDIAGWTEILSPQIYESAIEEKIAMIGEAEGRICALGILDPEKSEISAIYVHPDETGKGAGKQMLAALEAAALKGGADRLHLCATLNAVGFYRHHGYVGEEKTAHLLPTGAKLACIRMKKRLALRSPVVVAATMEDIAPWLELAQEVEHLFGPMADDPAFRDTLNQAIADETAFCIRSGENGRSLKGAVAVSAPSNEIAWLAVSAEHRASGFGRALVRHAIDRLDPKRPIRVQTFDESTPEGKAARRLYTGFGFADAADAGENPAGVPTVIMQRPPQNGSS